MFLPALLFVVAFAMRLAASLRIEAIFDDGPRFIQIARLMAEGGWSQALADSYHPLYSFLIFLSHFMVDDWERAAVLVSVVAGSASVLAVYYLVRASFSAEAAWIAGVLAAFHPYAVIFSADVQSEGLYAALFLSSAALLWRAVSALRVKQALGAGCLAGLAYLTRPEGLGVLVVGVGLLAIQLQRQTDSRAQVVRCTAALLVGATILAAPYVLALHSIGGEWTLTNKKSVSRMLGGDEAKRASGVLGGDEAKRASGVLGGDEAKGAGLSRRVSVGSRGCEDEAKSGAPGDIQPGSRLTMDEVRELIGQPGASGAPANLLGARAARQQGRRALWGPHLATIYDLAVVATGAFRYELFLVLAFGIYASRGRPTLRAAFVGSFLCLYAIILYGLTLNYGYVSRRHVLPPMFLLLGYAAVGVPALGHWLLARARRSTSLGSRRAAIAVGLALVAVLAVPKGLSSRREDAEVTRLAAEWLRDRPALHGPVAAARSRLAYYAGEEFVPLTVLERGRGITGLIDAGACFLILDQNDLDRVARLTSLEQLRPLHRVEVEGTQAIVFALTRGERGKH